MMRNNAITIGALLLVLPAWVRPVDAQVRGGRRTAVAHGEDGRAAAAGPRGVAVKGEEGYAAAGRRGAVKSTEEGYAAAGRHGAVATGEEGYAAVGRRGAVVEGEEGYARVGPRGAVVAGEEGYRAVGRGGVVVGHNYESYEAWRAVAGIGAAIAIGTMLAKPPKAATTVTHTGSTYYYDAGTYYTRVISGGDTVYQVVAPPAGIIIPTLPSGCQSVQVGGVAYSQCGTTHYQRVSTGYQVVVLN